MSVPARTLSQSPACEAVSTARKHLQPQGRTVVPQFDLIPDGLMAQPLALAKVTLYKNNLAFCEREGKLADSHLESKQSCGAEL